MKARILKFWFIIFSVFLFSACFTTVTNRANADSGGSGGYYSYCTLTTVVNLPGAGTVLPKEGSLMFDYGMSATVSEHTNTGFVFDGWYLNGVYQGKLSSVIVTMDKNNELVAVFSKRMVALTITANPEGATTAPAPGVWNYTYGDSVVVKEYPTGGSVFDGWYLDGQYMGAGTSITVNMDKDHQLGAYFVSLNSFAPSSSAPTQSETPSSAPTTIPATNPTSTSDSTPTPTLNPTPTNSTSLPTPVLYPTPSPSLPSPTLVFSCTSSTAYTGFNVEINGQLTVNRIGLSGAGVSLSYSASNGDSWADLAFVNTNDDGRFVAVWMPSASGNYLLNATWKGDSAYSRATTIVNFAVTPPEGQSVFSVSSNSTLSGFSFDSAKRELSFSVAGESGTVGYVRVSIPKTLMADVAGISVLLDGTQLDYTSGSQGDSWIVSFVYHHSSHEVIIDMNPSAVQPTAQPSEKSVENWTIYIAVAAIVVIVALVALIAVKKRKSNKK